MDGEALNALKGLVNNAAMLLALALLYDTAALRVRRENPGFKVLLGILVGAIGIAVMMNPWELMRGIIFDTRSILLSMAALFYGAIPTLIAVLFTALFRLYQGGDGTGVGLGVIATSAMVGLIWRKMRHYDRRELAPGWLELYLIGLIVHVAMLLWMLAVPGGKGPDVIRAIGWPVMLVHPVGTVLLGLLLAHQRQRRMTGIYLDRERSLLRQVMETSPVGIVMADRSGVFNFANPLARQMLRLENEPSDAFGIETADWIVSDLQGNPLKKEELPFYRVRRTMTALYDAQCSLAWPDGRQVQLSINAAPIVDEQGALTGVVSTLEDITRRRRVEARIRQLNRVLKVLSNINQAINRLRDPHRLLEEACRITVHDGGFRLVFVLWNNRQSGEQEFAVHALARDDSTAVLKKALADGEFEGGVAKEALRRGERIVVTDFADQAVPYSCREWALSLNLRSCAAFPLEVLGERAGVVCLYSAQPGFFDDEDELRLLEDLAGDISFALEFSEHELARHRAEEDLRASERRYRSIFSDSQASMLLVDPADGRILDANKSACRYYGWSLEQLRAMTIREINASSDEKLAEQVQQAAGRQQSYFTFKHRLANGELRDVEVYSGQVEVGDRKVLYSIVHDISERVQAERQRDHMEAQLRQAQKMEAVGRLAGGIAHDVNNMLTVIMGYSESLLNSLGAGEQTHQWAGEISSAAKRSAGLTQQLLAFSRKQIVQPKVIDVNKHIQDQKDMLARLIGEDMELTFLAGEGLWNVMMDPSQLDQIMANLSVNARDAVQGVGAITVETENITLDASYSMRNVYAEPGDYVLLSFSDTGQGIAPEHLDQIFEPFFTTKGEGEGTGLGLSTVYGIVKQNGGVIHAYSEPGMGTTFKIYLPRYEGQVERMRQSSQNEPLRGDETVLVVEDEQQILNLTRAMLNQYGYHVLTARTPAEACELARGHAEEIQLLLTDVVMPGMNGRELQREMTTIVPRIKALFMSGYTANVIAHRGVLDEGVNFIQKPFTMDALVRKVRDVLDG